MVPRAGLRWAGLVARIVVGVVWLWAGLLKVSDPAASVTAVRAYQLLPTSVVDPVGRALPMVEVLVGTCLVVGLLTRVSGIVSAVLQLAFILGIGSVWARGISINCGCFGDGGYDPHAASHYPWEIARDVGLLALALFVAWLRRIPFALDNVIFPQMNERADVEATA